MTTIHDTNDNELLAALQEAARTDPDNLRAILHQISEPGTSQRGSLDGCARVADPGTELAEGQDGAVALDDLPAIERVIATNNLLPVHFLSEGALVQRAVARVEVPGGYGTGSLISDGLLLTNNHVIASSAAAEDSKARFNHQRDHEGVDQADDVYGLDPDDFFYTNAALDFTVVRVKSKLFPIRAFDQPLVAARENDLRTPPLRLNPARDLPKVVTKFPRIWWFYGTPGSRWGHLPLPTSGPSYAVGQYYNVVGHPQARRKEVSLQDNKVTHIYTDVVHYTTDTEPGSSGSPVFNNQWELVALHHAAGDWVDGQWVDNEGIRIDKVVDDLQANVPAAIRTELGI